MDGDARVTTAVVGLLIAFCAVLLAKWLAVVALAALLLAAVLRVALRRVVRAVRGRRAPVAELVEPVGVGGVVGGATAVDRAVGAAFDRAAGPRRVVPVTTVGPPCSWCGLVGGHHDREGRPVRPRHAHALPAPARRAS
ncbi:hypothetical protein ACQPX6_25695 [Actinomycetospora sp. CA-101289]|uniref:hypothetical protein n=1 Tax=Actinomycetospora sp. CA-101289 TaxID=3239893 RepID=UPI003D968392